MPALVLLGGIALLVALAVAGRLQDDASGSGAEGGITLKSPQFTDSDFWSRVRDAATTFIAEEEGFSATAYPDPPGQLEKWSIGYGHQLRAGDGLSVADSITQAQASALLSQDIGSALIEVQRDIEVELTENQATALVSLAYNIGLGAFRGSTLLKLINAGDYAGASAQFPKWKYANGSVSTALVNRRANEQELFNA